MGKKNLPSTTEKNSVQLWHASKLLPPKNQRRSGHGQRENFSNTQQHRVLWFTMCYCIEWSIAIGARNPGNDVFCVIVHWADRMALHGHWTHHKTITCLNVKSKQTGEIKIKLALRVCAAQCHECDHLHQSTNRNIDREKKIHRPGKSDAVKDNGKMFMVW